MKAILSKSSKELICKFDNQLLDVIKEDVKKFRKKYNDNLINFSTRRFDLELQAILKAELDRLRKNSEIKLVSVG